ncbi:MAG TPA: hypothetical protein VGL59_02670 [Polyangia bacterium]
MLPLLGLLASAAVAPAAGCPSLVDAAISGAPGGLTALLARCSTADLIRAVEHAAGAVDLSTFARARRHGAGEVITWKARHRLRWEGTCVAQIDEAFPAADRLPAPACLVDAFVRDEYDPNELSDVDDDRARFLAEHPPLSDAFAACVGKEPGHVCLERLLPRAGGDRTDGSGRSQWIQQRDNGEAPAPPQPREMRCRAVLADGQSLIVRCEGTLAKSVCNSESTPIQVLAKPRCTSDHSLVVPVPLGEKPSPACLDAARAALLSSRAALPSTRRRALAICTAPPANGKTDGPATNKAVRDVDLSPSVRGLVAAVLRRQRALAGTITLPGPCARRGGGCVAAAAPGAPLVRRIGSGCGFDLWNVSPAGDGDSGGDSGGDSNDWREFHGLSLLRTKIGAVPANASFASERDLGAPWFSVGNTLRQGSHLSAPTPADKAPPTFNDLAAALCALRGADRALCTAYAAGGQPAEPRRASLIERWRRVRSAVQKDWPAAYRRFEARQEALSRGLALDRARGETRRQSCQPLLVDACTGDVAELCAVTPDEREPPCSGQRLPDGRCEVVRFGRLQAPPGGPDD